MAYVPFKDRFLEACTPEPMSGCWIWLHRADRDGYGRMRGLNKTEIGAHRWSYKLFVGEVPDNVKVLHRCDTPICVNPAHLFLGSQADNLSDATSKGRLRFTAPLSMELRNKIAASTLSRNATARQFRVSPRTVQDIWKSTREGRHSAVIGTEQDGELPRIPVLDSIDAP